MHIDKTLSDLSFMTNEEFKKGCDKLGELVKKLEACEAMLYETIPGDGDYEYYAGQASALRILVEQASRPLWKEVARRSPSEED